MITAFNSRFNNANSKQKLPTNHSYALVAFKCRLMALVLNNTNSNQPQQDEFIKACAIKGKNALLKQASWNRPGFNDEVHSPRMRDDDVYLKRNDDGWGVASYTDGRRNGTDKAPKSAIADECYRNAIEKSVGTKSDIIFAHLRQTLDPQSISLYNTHPFTYKNWTFMHNGNIDFSNNKFFEEKLNEYAQKYNLKVGGSTDSEKVFMLILGKLKDKGIDIENNDKDVPLEVLKGVFAETIKEIINKTPKVISKIQNTWYTGDVETMPTTNFIFSNGSHVLAFRHGPNLFLGTYQLDDGKKDYILSSEMMQPKDKLKIHWKFIENDNIITISKNKQGFFDSPNISPLASTLKEDIND